MAVAIAVYSTAIAAKIMYEFPSFVLNLSSVKIDRSKYYLAPQVLTFRDVIENRKNRRKIILVPSLVELQMVNNVYKYYVDFGSENRLLDELFPLVDDEEEILDSLRMYDYDIRRLTDNARRIVANQLIDTVYELFDHERPINLFFETRTGERMNFNVLDRDWNIVLYENELVHRVTGAVGVIYYNVDDGGCILSPALHVGSGYFLLNIRIGVTTPWPGRIALEFRGVTYKLTYFNVVEELCEEDRGIAVIRVYDDLRECDGSYNNNNNNFLKIGRMPSRGEKLTSYHCGLSYYRDIVLTNCIGSDMHLAWDRPMILMNEALEPVGFLNKLRSVYFTNVLRAGIIHKLRRYTPFEKQFTPA